jgi:hypothetical protein
MIAYKVFEAVYGDTNVDLPTPVGGESNLKWSDMGLNHDLIEKSMKMYKTHQSIQDIDAKFIKKLNLEEEKVEFLKEVIVKMKTSF